MASEVLTAYAKGNAEEAIFTDRSCMLYPQKKLVRQLSMSIFFRPMRVLIGKSWPKAAKKKQHRGREEPRRRAEAGMRRYGR